MSRQRRRSAFPSDPIRKQPPTTNATNTKSPLTTSRRSLTVLIVLTFVVGLLISATGVWAKKPKKTKEKTVTAESRLREADTEELRERKMRGQSPDRDQASPIQDINASFDPKPKELRLQKAHEFNGDLRDLPQTGPEKKERPEREGPVPNPRVYVPPTVNSAIKPGEELTPTVAPPLVPMAAPTPIANFAGLDFATWGNGHPPDPNGDVGPNQYIQTINTSIGIFNKSTGALITGISFNNFMKQGNFGNLCDTDNFGDPVVVYDSFEDRWIITDFAFTIDGSGNVTSNAYQCI